MSGSIIFRNGRSEKEVRSWSARCGHVKRRISADEPLKGKTLVFALDLLKSTTSSDNEIIKIISEKIQKGDILSDYEKSIIEDAILTHSKMLGK